MSRAPTLFLPVLALAGALVGAACATAPAASPAVASVIAIAEDEIAVDVPAGGGDPAVRLACALTRPRARGRHPAVILLRGTGPSSRNYNDGPITGDLPRLLAARLAAGGVAVLRCDARGTGGTPGRFWDGTFATYLRDARAMLAALAAHEAIDAARLGVVGHSEGGIVAEVVAQAELRVRALALLGAGGDDFRAGVIAQRSEMRRRAGAAAAEVEATRAVVGQVLDAVAADQPLPPLPPELAAEVSVVRAWLRSRLAHDTRAAVRALRAMPVLVAQGDADWQTPATDADLIAADLSAGHNATTAVVRHYPGLNHHFAAAAVEGPDLPGAAIDERFVEDVVAFLRRSL